MVIERHPGPVGQIFYCDHSPERHDNPAWFDALNPGFFEYYFGHNDRGWDTTAMYVTDYSTVNYQTYTESGKVYITSHVSRESFGDAREATYVIGSEVYGAMAKAFVPFSSRDDAKAFRDEHGGELISFEDIDRTLLAR